MSVMRRTVLAVSDNRVVSGFFKSNRLARGLVDRFVAGESLEEGLAACRDLERHGIVTTLDQLGENVATVEEATAAAASFQSILRAMSTVGLETNISVKLTMLGLDLGRSVAEENLVSVLDVAKEVGGFVRIDMEGSLYTAITMEIFESLFARYPENVGIVTQTYLRRAEQDVKRAIELGARVRLVKGAYAEPESIAFTTRAENDQNYLHLMRLLLEGGNFPAIATHDPALIAAAQHHAKGREISPNRFEFQMLYGVRREEQQRLVDAGYRMRVYVPFGTEWYPYFTRRIAERPANALFVLRAMRGK
ncbi:MAG TPA: proline dehydrogenase family protein [Thermomicrobiales bacterium]|nr:proline dehydrogenase family protein [Thermomicrobiales bacterium]